jgi:hypothetical protein
MQDRDRSVEELLRQTRAAEPMSSVDCPDAETLAAMADDTLPAAMRRDIEAHVADCHRCQELTAAMARADAPVEAHAGVAADVAAWKRRALNWLVPAAAAATAVALWILVPGQQAPAPTAPTADTQVEAVPPPLPTPTPEVIPNEPLRLPDDARADTAARDQSVEIAPAAQSARAAAPPPPPAAAAPPPPPAAPAAASPPPPPPAAPLRRADAPAIGGVQASPAEQRKEAALNESVAIQQERAANAQAFAAASLEIASPDPRFRWQIGPGLIVQRTIDGGRTWIAQQTGASMPLTAGSAPTPEVVWLVGRGGVVLRTTDGGAQWQRVPFPEVRDLTAITATSATNATVVVADGRRFTTADGGAMWMLVR